MRHNRKSFTLDNPISFSVAGGLRVLRPARVGGEGHAGNHGAHVPHFLHESGERRELQLQCSPNNGETTNYVVQFLSDKTADVDPMSGGTLYGQLLFSSLFQSKWALEGW